MTELVPAEVKALSPEQLFERFLRLSIADGIASPRTLNAYRQGLGAYFNWCHNQAIEPVAASYDQIQEYRQQMGASHKRATVRLRLRAVKILYDALQRWGRRQDNPAAGVRAPKEPTARETSILRKALSPSEASQFLAALPDVSTIPGARDRALMMLALFHGLRADELRKIKPEDLGPGYHSIRIHGKGSKDRIIALLPFITVVLETWVKMMGPFRSDERPIFYGLDKPGAQQLSIRSIERITDFYLSKAGLKQAGRSVHALRHTYAVLAVLGGAEREVLAASMGHADMRTTDLYTRAAATMQKSPALAVMAALKASEEASMNDGQNIGSGLGPNGETITFWSMKALAAKTIILVRSESGERITHSETIEALAEAGYKLVGDEDTTITEASPVMADETPKNGNAAPQSQTDIFPAVESAPIAPAIVETSENPDFT